MRVFVTGASGFVGSAIVKELLSSGHQVLGLVRSDSAAQKLTASGAEVCLGDVNNIEIIQRAASTCDAVIHTAFNHDFSQYKANCEADRIVIEAFGEALMGSEKPLVITSALGLLNYDRPVTEDDALQVSSTIVPRAASEEAATAVSAKGVRVYVVRLPASVHGSGDHGFIPVVINTARDKGESAYVGEGHNRWPAVHRDDAAIVYRLVVEKQPSLKVLHAVAEEGIAFKQIAKVIGDGLHLPVISKTGDDIAAHFGWFAHFASIDCPSSNKKTVEQLGWEPKGAGLIEDIKNAGYL
ncbi:SDR family oxidoreductase [Mucilaginibacter paludis]|uniref:NAD-dependent epimerase/dehydratase n=1 Tax=Mucilaginibacter paludis DSM 18603 TaxID=714943 RepID=H1YAK5_9SPHI|nr:SDR family oxidoreductase [Mucilaginibacter paludis]EHQ29125.1 NAD-dependent epimerase/dehydratase [Mucilaginibacter paludis DSM 18603]